MKIVEIGIHIGGMLYERNSKIETYYQKHSNPTPFNPITHISYYLSKDTKVILEIYNINGELITILCNGVKTAGYHSIEWNAKLFQSGIYFINIINSNKSITKKIIKQ